MSLTPLQLQGDLCKSPNHCQPVDYFAFPGGAYTDQGAAKVVQAIDALPDDEQIVLFGHSQGGQVVYSDLRRFAADPASAPDPSRLSWVSIGNPENQYGGRRAKTEPATDPWLPPDTAYQGTEVIRQYDGWADWPDDPRNLLAVANAIVGMFSIHTNYRQVDLDDPNNVRYTPEVAGQPGQRHLRVGAHDDHAAGRVGRAAGPGAGQRAAANHREGVSPAGRHSGSHTVVAFSRPAPRSCRQRSTGRPSVPCDPRPSRRSQRNGQKTRRRPRLARPSTSAADGEAQPRAARHPADARRSATSGCRRHRRRR